MVRTPDVYTLNSSKIWKNSDLEIVKINWDASLNSRAGVIGGGGGGSSVERSNGCPFSYKLL
jgi:hypothetical protein